MSTASILARLIDYPSLAAGRRSPTAPAPSVPRAIRIVQQAIAVPALAQSRRGEVPVWPHLLEQLAQIAPQVLWRGAAPEPVAVVDLVDDEVRREDEGVREHRVVPRVGVLLNVQVPLDYPLRIA